MDIGALNILGIIIIIVIIAGISIISGRKVKNGNDFVTSSGKAGSLMVCGAIMGSLVSGQATIGTAQLAFTYGLSAWWFTLGAGIGCLFLAFVYAKGMRESGSVTVLQIIGNSYGQTAETLGSVLCTIGIFISVVAQVIAATALLMTIFPVNYAVAGMIAATLMLVYVVFGGFVGAGMSGIVKLFLLYMAGVAGFVIVVNCTGGMHGLSDELHRVLCGTALGDINGTFTEKQIQNRYSNLFSRGVAKDLGSGISLILGVLATQTYAQAVMSAKSHKAAKKGALFSAFLIPPIGAACTIVGLFMRTQYITKGELEVLHSAGMGIPEGMKVMSSAAQAFPVFAVTYMPKLVGGIVIGTLFITVIGGGAGLSLGMASIVVNDILMRISRKFLDAKKYLVSIRIVIGLILCGAFLVAFVTPGAIINDFGFLSMGIRGTVVFLPLTTALFMEGKVSSRSVIISMLAGPVVVLVGNMLNLTIDPLLIGIFVCVVILSAHTQKNMAEGFLNSAILAMSGGLMDAYTYFTRDEVFSNAQTGNVVLMSEHFIMGEWKQGLGYLLPLFAFILGVFVAEQMQNRSSFCHATRLYWRQNILLFEIFILFAVGFIPKSLNTLAAVLVSFACSMQVQSFRTVKEYAYASTMCIGNLRSGTAALSVYMREGNKEHLRRAAYYFGIIFFFAVGAGIGGVLSVKYGLHVIWISSALLLVSFILLFFNKKE